MRRSSVLVTAPAAEPVSLTEVKNFCRIDSSTEDDLLNAFIVAARQFAEQYLRRVLINQTWRLSLDLGCSSLDDELGDGVYELPVTALYGSLPRVIELWPCPVSSITSIKTYDLDNTESTFSSDNYTLNSDSSRVILNYGSSWPSNLRREAAATITFVAGYGAAGTSVPQAIRTAILSHISKMYDERVICDLPDGSARLMRPYRIMDGLAHG